jgi:SAM-dependent methyltransferase
LFQQIAKSHLKPSCHYVGLDYYETAKKWYGTVPDVYGDALHLPIAEHTIDAVVLIDVIEHIRDSRRLLEQINLVLKPGGKLIFSLPFLYPIHDAPLDFVRFTFHGIEQLAEDTNFVIEHCEPVGSPMTTSLFLLNVALTKTAINWMSEKKIWALLSILIFPMILLNNLLAKALSVCEVEDGFMANSYQLVLKK